MSTSAPKAFSHSRLNAAVNRCATQILFNAGGRSVHHQTQFNAVVRCVN